MLIKKSKKSYYTRSLTKACQNSQLLVKHAEYKNKTLQTKTNYFLSYRRFNLIKVWEFPNIVTSNISKFLF